jgi:hypothetical protein
MSPLLSEITAGTAVVLLSGVGAAITRVLITLTKHSQALAILVASSAPAEVRLAASENRITRLSESHAVLAAVVARHEAWHERQ